MRLLHTEASPGWGGQEIRILREAEGMRERGHTVILCIQKGGGLVDPARQLGFEVHECDFSWKKALPTAAYMAHLIWRKKIDCVITHSSKDAWIVGATAKFMQRPVIRTRHLSSRIRAGLNSYFLYNLLADRTVTTCAEIVPMITSQSQLEPGRCVSVPTGIKPFSVSLEQREAFRIQYQIKPDDIVVGTLCILRGWKGVCSLIRAAFLLKERENLKWLIVGSGPVETYLKELVTSYGITDRVIFTGQLQNPAVALSAMDIFSLCSYAHEGVSQASLQAAWLKKPLITTPIGGLKEVCIPSVTGYLVPPKSSDEIAKAVLELMENVNRREEMGLMAHQHVQNHFMFDHMLDKMEEIIHSVCHSY
jgi:glycosyltransferase involved in cell wall biosynthesis